MFEVLIPSGDAMDGSWNKFPPIPRETARTARAVFGPDNFYMQVGDRLDSIVAGIELESLATSSESEPLFPLVTFFQALEGLVDSQAVDAMRARIDWKYALHMPVRVPILHEDALCEFRCKVISDQLAQREFKTLISRLLRLKPPLNQKLHGIKGEEVISLVCSINHMASLKEAIHRALETLAARYPEWLQKTALPHWYGRYSGIASGFTSFSSPSDEQSLIKKSIDDIDYLFERIHLSGSIEMYALEEIRTLDQIRSRRLQQGSQTGSNETTKFTPCVDCPCRGGIRRQ